MTTNSADIPGILAAHLSQGEALLRKAHNLSDDQMSGCIEAVAIDETGRCWVLGWARKSIGNAVGVLVLDRRKHAGAMVMARFPREDLPEDATGFIGLLQSEWQPEIDAKIVIFVLSTEGNPHLRTVGAALRRVDMRAISMIVEAARGSIRDGYFRELRSLLSAPESWVPGLARATNVPVELGVDSIVAIPGVGCMVEGWMLTPTRPVTGFSLRAGDVVSNADARCSFRMPRPDLAAAFPRHAGLVGDAGFVAFFPLREAKALSEGLTLKLYHGDTVSTNHSLSDKDIQWLHRGAGEDVLLRCYPAIECEQFFPALAAMLKRNAVVNRPPPVAWQSSPSPKLAVLGVSDSPSECYRVMDQVMQLHGALAERGFGIALVAQEAARPHILPLFRELDPLGKTGVSLFFARHPVSPRDIAAVLATTGSSDFVLLRENFRTSPAELLRLADTLAHDSASHTTLSLVQEATAATLEGPPAIGWQVAPLIEHVRKGAAWGDLPAGFSVGSAFRTSQRPALRPMLMKLERAGVSL